MVNLVTAPWIIDPCRGLTDNDLRDHCKSEESNDGLRDDVLLQVQEM